MGFTFVDRISAIESDHARGELRSPPHQSLPPWLLIEAVGQLAAWIAMLRADFASRPVAALVPQVRLSGVESGPIVDLEARIERFDGRAVLYSGTARSNGVDLAVLTRCVGPLLPMETFDDPAAVRRRFESLCAEQPAAGGRCADHPVPRPTLSDREIDDEAARARLHVPDSAPFFSEHFPRFPVYPAVLLADAQNQLAAPLAARLLGAGLESVRPSAVIDFKVRSFSAPGQVLELLAATRAVDAERARIAVSAAANGKRVASGVLEYCRAGAST